MQSLAVWMNGVRVGTWSQARGRDSFQYDPTWVQSDLGRALSLSLPFTHGNVPHLGDVVRFYFDNLLPDSGPIRSRLQSKFGTPTAETFDLLAAIGRDCVGAVQLLPPDDAPDGFDRIRGDALDDAGVESLIAGALSPGRVLGQNSEGEFRVSIAGAQEKTALLRHKERWCRPRGATPTTHIVKLSLGLVGHLQADMKDSVENEWLCAKLFEAYELPVAKCEIVRFGARKVLVVERFDRRPVERGRWIARLPQEDFCQALGLSSAMKYEGEGGPGMGDILRVLAVGAQSEVDRRAFVKAQILFWLLAATDGHAKNFSIFHEAGGRYRLTPFYDILSAWPVIGTGPGTFDWRKLKLAMAVRSKNAHWKLSEIKPRHWDAITTIAGLGEARPLIEEIVAQTEPAIVKLTRALPNDFPDLVAHAIFSGLREGVSQLEKR
jgi:serine/threonine-protein kinase HipA